MALDASDSLIEEPPNRLGPTPPRSTVDRLSDLFRQGEVLILEDSEGEFYIWVHALNEAQREEAQIDGSTARAFARQMVARRTPINNALRAELAEMPTDDIVNQLLGSRVEEAWRLAYEDLRADEKEWPEDRLLIIDRGLARLQAALTEDADAGEVDTETYAAYNADWRRRATEHLEEIRVELAQKPRKELIELTVTAWCDAKVFGDQQREIELTTVFYAARVCRAVRVDKDNLDHSACDGHRVRLYDSRRDVADVPDRLFSQLTAAIAILDAAGGNALGKSPAGPAS